MSATVSGRIWDEASAPPAVRLVRRYEADWATSRPGHRPDPENYLPDDPSARSAARLALLRAELALRRAARESGRIEDFVARFPHLDDETLVALIYEELCLREDDGEEVNPVEYLERFPRVAERLRRVLDIHDLVGSARTISLPSSTSSPPAVAFPEVGQTIAGFYLVNELGRGSFARVFQARERQLADRPVALKVARAGSREPQTLARLQHTHIVPVHSYRIDQVTGLHLLCMPYLGGVTLERLLADPQVRLAGQGTDLLAALDRLGAADGFAIDRGAAARRELVQRDFWRAVAWWGAQLAEALQHAHERGVLHRDIKPSNVLVTGDGVPMLLDFNLAWEACIDDSGATDGGLGGTVAYMSPEHLEAVAEGQPGEVDARSDIYSLGVLLYEAMDRRPFPPPPGARSVIESLLRAAALRREGPPPLREQAPRVPPELEAVILRCLAPNPADRYPDAASLATDLRAVADDAPLKLAREPLASRGVRWLRRNRLRVAVAVPLMMAPTVVAFGLALAKLERTRIAGERFGEVKQLIEEGKTLLSGDQIAAAEFRFATAQELAKDAEDTSLQELALQARDKHRYVQEIERIRDAADTVLQRADPLKLRLLGFTGPVGDPSDEVRRTLAPFYVLSHEVDWTKRADLILLDKSRKTRLLNEIDNLLFLWVIALDAYADTDPGCRELALWLCQRAASTTTLPGPWEALRDHVESRAIREPHQTFEPRPNPGDVQDPRECFLWGVLSMHEQRAASAVRWLTRAAHVDVDQYWYSFYLGYLHQQLGDVTAALGQYNVAIALRPEVPWTRFNRARLYQSLGAYQRTLDDLNVALSRTRGPDRLPILLNLALVHEDIGDLRAARAGYEQVRQLAHEGDPLQRAARMNLARLEAQSGAVEAALQEYATLIEDSAGRDHEARLARALVSIRLGRSLEALDDLDILLAENPDQPAWLAARAEALLMLERAAEAAAAADAAARLEPSPGHQRLRLRARLASGQLEDLGITRPEELLNVLDSVPAARSALRARLKQLERSDDKLVDLLDSALIRSVLRDHSGAEAAASRALELVPGSSRALQVRARVRARASNLDAALSDVETGLSLDPGDPRFLVLRAELSIRLGAYQTALEDLDRAGSLGEQVIDSRNRAIALSRLGRHEQAIGAWTEVLRSDPENAEAYLARAHAFCSLGSWHQAIADLERAANWAARRADLLSRLTLGYARCLPARPDLLPRVLLLCRRTIDAALPWPERSGRTDRAYARNDRD